MTRRNAAPPITLFSFQDIITSVMGIVILLLLILSLELLSRRLDAPTSLPPPLRIDLQPEISQAHALRDQLRLQFEASEADLAESAGQSVTDVGRRLHDLERQSNQLQSELDGLIKQRDQLAHSAKQAEADQTGRTQERSELARQRQELARLHDELQNLRSSKRVFFSNPTGGQSKHPWLVEVSDNTLQAALLGKRQRPTVFVGKTSTERVRDFLAWSRRRDQQSEYFVLLVRPSGIESCNTLNEELRKQRFDVGLDLIDRDQEVIDPELGAGAWQSPTPTSGQ